jgi:hypothetical protein
MIPEGPPKPVGTSCGLNSFGRRPARCGDSSTGESNCLLRKELHPSDSGRILDAQYERGLYFDELCRRAEEFAWTGHDEARYRLEYISNRAQDSRGGCSCHNDEVKYLTDQLLPRLDGDFAMFQGHWL